MGHFKIEFESKITDVPESFPNVEGFFSKLERIDDNFECTPQTCYLDFYQTVSTATNGTAIDRWVITELTASLGV
jgi:hypothetical protein